MERGIFLSKLLNAIQRHIRMNIPYYFIVILFFAIGVVAGTYTVKALPDLQKIDLMEYLEGFFQIIKSQEIDNHQLFLQSFFNSIKIFIPILILGLTIIGAPFILLLLSFRGFILGFTLGFVVDELALRGVLFIILTILPHNLFYIPGLIGIGVIALSLSVYFLKNRIRKQLIYNKKEQIWTYLFIMFSISILLLIGSLIEAYFAPILMKALSLNLIP